MLVFGSATHESFSKAIISFSCRCGVFGIHNNQTFPELDGRVNRTQVACIVKGGKLILNFISHLNILYLPEEANPKNRLWTLASSLLILNCLF